MPRTISLPDSETASSSPIYRNANATDRLSTTPETGINTLYDLIVRKGFTERPSKEILGQRRIVRTVEEQKEVTKKLPGGGLVTETKTWKYFELSGFEWLTWKQIKSLTHAYASGYRALGLRPGDKLTIYADTSRDWLLTAISCITQSITITTAYATLGEEGLTYSLNECEISTVFTNSELLPMLLKVVSSVKSLKNVVYNGSADEATVSKFLNEHKHIKLLTLSELEVLGKAHPHNAVPPSPDDLAVIMYTSGSTGPPKGVMLTHANVVATISGYHNHFLNDFRDGDVYLAFLPLTHILEYSVEFFLVFLGVPIGYGSVRTLTDASVRNCKGDLRELRPTAVSGVPAVWDSIRKGVETKVRNASAVSRVVFNAAFGIKSTLMSIGVDSLAAPLDALVFKAVKEQVGGRLRFALSAGAPIPKSTQEYLNVTTARVVNAYGMTETTAGLIIQAVQDSTFLGIVGAPLTSGEVKLVDVENTGYKVSNLPKPQGEVWFRGPTVMRGYYKQEALTRETITEDGWMRTGDIAELNENGTFTVIDRTKNLVKLSNGEYIALEKLESNYKVSKLVANICMHADPEQAYAVAIVIPVEKEVRHLAGTMNLYPGVAAEALDYTEICQSPEVRAAVLENLKGVAKSVGFKPAEVVGQVHLTSQDWTPQNGMLTAAMKLQRKAIISHYEADIAAMYSR
ncbi:long-chain-fatty-acid-CoA-ligase [Chytriomyces sp. MP71]|nr:long-chain-fatty-acid-CoA-ligase [Chytriomyces sp. MP71]